MILNTDGYTDDLLTLRKKYRTCFANNREVLKHILVNLGTYQEIKDDPGAVALRNFGVYILDILGANDEENLKHQVDMLFSLPVAPNQIPTEEETFNG